MEKMTFKITLILLIISSYSCTLSQECNADLNFLIGLTGDYGGVQYVPSDYRRGGENYITYFRKSDTRALIAFKKELIDNKIDFEEIPDSERASHVYISSKSCASHIRNYFNFEKEFSIYINEESDLEHDVYVGRIKEQKFKTTEQKLNYLKGVFIRYCQKLSDDTFKFNFTNSSVHFEFVQKILDQLGEKILMCEESLNQIPNHQSILFEPSNRLKKKLNSPRWPARSSGGGELACCKQGCVWCQIKSN